MLLLFEVSFSVINNLGTPSSELEINFGVLQIDAENSTTGICIKIGMNTIDISCAGPYKTFRMHYRIGLEMDRSTFGVYLSLTVLFTQF